MIRSRGLLIVTYILYAAAGHAGNITYESAWPIKGGIATIGSDAYISLRSDRNKIVLAPLKTSACKGLGAFDNCRNHWVGKDANEVEIVFTDGNVASDSTKGLDISKLKIVMFSPKEVRVIDLGRDEAFKYPRQQISK